VSVSNKSTWAEFSVLHRSNNTATELCVLKVGLDSAAIHTESDAIKQEMVSKYLDMFNGVGKLKDRQIKLHVKPEVSPLPNHFREHHTVYGRLKRKLQK